MCNFNVLVKSEKGNKDNLINFLSCVTAISFNSNGDGDGIYFNNKDFLIKSEKKINLLRLGHKIINSKFILSHQRLATHGKTSDYIQPFVSDRFVFGHNGIMPSFAEGKHSDSYGFFNEFLKQFSVLSDVVKTIGQMLNDKYLGSYSIFLYDKKTSELYYFKNYLTNINVYRTKDKKVLYATTNSQNAQFLKMFFPEYKFKELTARDNVIYKIWVKNKKVLIDKVGKIKEKKFIYEYKGQGGQSNFNDFVMVEGQPVKEYKNHKKLTLEEIKRKLEVIELQEGLCDGCHKKTENFSRVMYERICNDCLEEDGQEIINELGWV